ncbi:hypothetical protein AAC387_Pa02g4764 [Persea americana]
MLRGKELVDEGGLKRMLRVTEKQFLKSYVTKYEKEVPNLMKAYKYSEKKIKAGMDFYVNKLKWKPSEVVSVPILLMFNLEERVVPRSKVWKMLKCKGLVNEGELKKMLMLSEERFLQKYVTAYEKQVPNLLKAYNSREMYNFSCGMITTLISAAPRFLCANVNKTLKPKVDFFRGLGISDSDITDLITSDPGMLMRGLKTQIIPSMDFLRNLVHTNENAVRAFRRCRWMVTSDVKKRMQSNIAVLKEYGLPNSQITDLAKLKPSILAQKNDWLIEILERVEELGFQRGSSVFVTALLTMSSLKKTTVEAKLELLKSIGLSPNEILETLRRMPSLLRYSEKKIEAGMDFYVNKLKWKPSEVVSVPILLMFSLEERVVPRSKVWKTLKCKGLVNEGELKKMLMLIKERFLRKYVTAYEKQVPNLLKAYNSRETYNFSCGIVKVK